MWSLGLQHYAPLGPGPFPSLSSSTSSLWECSLVSPSSCARAPYSPPLGLLGPAPRRDVNSAQMLEEKAIEQVPDRSVPTLNIFLSRLLWVDNKFLQDIEFYAQFFILKKTYCVNNFKTLFTTSRQIKFFYRAQHSVCTNNVCPHVLSV